MKFIFLQLFAVITALSVLSAQNVGGGGFDYTMPGHKIKTDMSFGTGKTLTIESGATLTIASGATFNISGINATSVANGSVSNTEFQLLDGVTVIGNMLKSDYDQQGIGVISGSGVGGGNLQMNASVGAAGSIRTNGGDGTDAFGGDVYTYGGASVDAHGGTINTNGGTLPGGAILTYDGGGAINTRGTGSIQLGAIGTRTTLTGEATGNRTAKFPANSTSGYIPLVASTSGVLNISGSEITGTLSIGNGGTGQTTANAALNALLPSQTGNSGKVLGTDGSNASWVTSGGGLTIGTTAVTSGTAGRLLFEGAGNVVSEDADLTFSGDTLTFTRGVVSGNGATSSPSTLISGTWFTGGDSTTTKPQLLIEPAGTTSTGWFSLGAALGINAPSGWSGFLFDGQVNGSRVFSIQANGAVNSSSIVTAVALGLNNGGYVYGISDGVIRVSDSTGTAGTLQIGGTGNDSPAIKKSSTTLSVRLADDSGYAPVQSLYERFGSGSPEGVVTAPAGAIYHNTSGGANVSIYVKESGSGNTGWVAK